MYRNGPCVTLNSSTNSFDVQHNTGFSYEYERDVCLVLSYEYMEKTGLDNRASVRGSRLGLALRTLITIRYEVMVDSQADARLERGLEKVTSTGSMVWLTYPMIAAAAGNGGFSY